MRIDLNADVGEGHDDLPIFAHVSSVSIACGAHAGDEATMERSVAEAVRLGVAVGAHPGYPDREGFGRRDVPMTPEDLRDTLVAQISTLAAIAARHGTALAHVKPHGALYNASADDPELARLLADAVRLADPSLSIVGLAGSAAGPAADAVGIGFVAEAFADRRYLSSGRLAPRSFPDALITDPAESAAQAVALATGEAIGAVDGDAIRVDAQTICIHADTPGAVDIASAITGAFARLGIEVGAPERG